jgi:pimeloyl-ACP methyl ester carboxylesterase
MANQRSRVRASLVVCATTVFLFCLSGSPAVAQLATGHGIVTGSAGLGFYTPPKQTPVKRHGAPIWVRNVTGAGALQPAASNTLVLYRSVDASGKPDAVSGIITVPQGKLPKGGWPILTWAHGTTGIADTCAPSREPAAEYVSYAYPAMYAWLRAGYAIVRTDYQGLGTPGVHGYLIGIDEGRSVLDIVRAARRLVPKLSNKVIIGGHSQGGHAALWAAALASSWTPELKIAGTVAFAPVSHIGDVATAVKAATSSALTPFAALILRGADSGDPALQGPSLLTDRGATLYPLTLTQCEPQLEAANEFGGMSPSEMIRSDADLAPLVAYLNANDPETLRIPTPVEILQGGADEKVFPPLTDQLASELQANGASVTYKKYDGVMHRAIVSVGNEDALAFAQMELGRRAMRSR